MFTVRCQIFNHSAPLQSRQHLTVTAVCLCSLTIWISSAVAGVICKFIVRTLSLTNSTITFFIVNVIILSMVCSVVILLHIKKIRTLQNSLSVTEQSQRRMNIVVTVIISIFVLYQSTVIATNIIRFLIDQRYLTGYPMYLVYFYIFIACMNYSCNPYILFLSQFI